MLPNGSFINFIDGTRDVRQCGDSRKLVQMMEDAGKKVGTKAFTGN
jgi:glutaredoxin-related protein